jgi:hypothetical protein
MPYSPGTATAVGRFFPILVVTLTAWLVHTAQAQAQAQTLPPSSKDAPAKAAPSRPDRSKPAPNSAKAKARPAPATAPQPDNVPRTIAPVPMEVFAAEPDPRAPDESADAGPEKPSACQIRVADKIAVIEPLPALGGPGDCGATDVVRLEAIIQPDKSRVAVNPPATMRCTMAEAVAVWVREDLTASTAELGSPPQTLDNYASYDCRGRNRVAGARISQHGLANAIDIRGVRLSDGRFVSFTDRKLGRGFREAVRKSVCERFTTVLGPGSDGHHEDHIHMDLAERRGGYRLCQWNVLDPADEVSKSAPKDVPLPRPRPKEAS